MIKSFLDDEIEWYKCYNTSDTLVFESNVDQMKLIVDKVKYKCPKNHNPYDSEGRYPFIILWMSCFWFADHQIGSAINVKMYEEIDTLNTVINVGAYNNQVGYRKYFRIFDLMAEEDVAIINNIEREIKSESPYFTEITLKDSIFEYKDYLKYIGSSIKDTTSSDSITDFVWSKNRGLISFTVHDTITYNLKKHIKHEPVIPMTILH